MDPASRTPKKPEPTPASLEQLIDHYNYQLPAYNAALAEHVKAMSAAQQKAAGCLPLEPLGYSDGHTKDAVVKLIRKQNHRLKRHIKPRAIELLMARAHKDGKQVRDMDDRSVGLYYSEILDQLRMEFPEASTSAACLRWYVVHMRDDANKEGTAWPDLPQVRPRSAPRREQAGSGQADA